MTHIARFCEKLVEAGWLVALIVVAAFMNPFSAQGFEPDKVALFRTLIALMAAAWAIWRIEQGATGSARQAEAADGVGLIARTTSTLRQTPIVGLALILLLVYVVATIASIAPRTSLWGSYQRAQGTFTFAAYLGLFFVVFTFLRRPDQLSRLITVLLGTSFLIATYGILQHYGVTLFQFSGGTTEVEERVISTLGNPIFLAAYLIMVMPLALWRALEAVRTRAQAPARSASGIALYGGLFVLQLAAVYFSQSRGPLLGLLAELFVFGMLAALLHRRRGWAMGGVLAGVVVGALLLTLNLPGLSAGPLQNLPVLQRLSNMTDVGASGTVQSRVLAWETILEAVDASSGETVVGYGPQTMKYVFARYMPADLWELGGSYDQAHNGVLNALFARGTSGAVGYLLLFGLLFYQTLRWMGFVRGHREAVSLIGLLAGGAVLGAISAWFWRGDWVFAGFGLQAGMVAGLALYLVGKTLFAPAIEIEAGKSHLLLLAALLAAVVGHFTESLTGVGVVSTRSYFWLYAALIALLGTARIQQEEPAPTATPQSTEGGRSKRGQGRRSRRQDQVITLQFSAEEQGPVITMGLMAAALLGTAAYAFSHQFNVPSAQGPALVLMGLTWSFFGLLVLLERNRSGTSRFLLTSDALMYASVSLIWVLPFALYHRSSVRALEDLPSAYLVFVVWLLLTVAGVAAAIPWKGMLRRSGAESGWTFVYPALALLALLIAWNVDLNRVRADIHYKAGQAAMNAGRWDTAIPNFQQAVRLQPRQDQYYIYLGGAYLEQARLAPELPTKDAWLEEARQVYEHGRELAPLDSDHPRQLAKMYEAAVSWAPDEATRRQRLEQALEHYQASVDLSPENPTLRLELANAYAALGMWAQAQPHYQHVAEMGLPTYLGRAYAGLGDVYLSQDRLSEAAEAYQQAMQADQDNAVLRSRISAVGDNPENVQLHKSLALAYAAADREDDAVKELNAALDIASSDGERAELQELIGMLEK